MQGERRKKENRFFFLFPRRSLSLKHGTQRKLQGTEFQFQGTKIKFQALEFLFQRGGFVLKLQSASVQRIVKKQMLSLGASDGGEVSRPRLSESGIFEKECLYAQAKSGDFAPIVRSTGGAYFEKKRATFPNFTPPQRVGLAESFLQKFARLSLHLSVTKLPLFSRAYAHTPKFVQTAVSLQRRAMGARSPDLA